MGFTSIGLQHVLFGVMELCWVSVIGNFFLTNGALLLAQCFSGSMNKYFVAIGYHKTNSTSLVPQDDRLHINLDHPHFRTNVKDAMSMLKKRITLRGEGESQCPNPLYGDAVMLCSH